MNVSNEQVMKDLNERYTQTFNRSAPIPDISQEEPCEWPELFDRHRPKAYAQDPLTEYNIGTKESPKPIKVSSLLTAAQQRELVDLVTKHAECLAWNYSEMPGLDPKLIEHRLPIKKGYRPFKQAPRRFDPELMPKIREEIKRLLDAKFIRPCRYAEWLSNIVPVLKKNGKMRV